MAGRFSIETIFKAIDKMTGPIARMQKRVSVFADASSKELKKLDDITSGFTSSVHTTSAAMLGFGAAAAVGLAAAAKPGMEFEQQMADLGASFLKTRGEIGPLEKEALKLGAATKFSATEIAGAMEAMSKAGFDEEQTLKGIAGMTYAAAAAGEDLIETTANVAAVIKGMEIDVSQSTKVADVLALASVKTASSIGSLAESLSKAGPVAKQFGYELIDTTAMVASLQDAGIDASESGSAVATMLTKLATPTDAMRAKMKKLGISFEDANGNMRKPAEVLGEFTKASKNAGGNMKQAAFFADLLGLRGQKAGLLLKNAFASGKYAKLVEQLEAAEGKAKEMADLRMNTLTGDIDVFTENVKGLGIELFSMSSGPLRDVVKGMTAWLDTNKTKVIEKIQAGVQWLIDNGPAIAVWAERIGKVVGAFYALAIAIKVISAIAAVFNPLGLVVASLIAIIAFWPEISAFFNNLWNLVSGVIAKLWDAWTGLMMGIVELFVGALVLIYGPAFRFIGELIGGWDRVGAFFVELWGGIVALFTANFGVLLAIGTGVVDGYMTVWGTLGSFFVTLWQGIVNTFNAILGPVFEKITWAVDQVRSIGRDTLGTDETSGAGSPQVVSPGDRIAQSISESTTTNQSELTIRDTTGKAVMTKSSRAPNTSIRLQPSGAF